MNMTGETQPHRTIVEEAFVRLNYGHALDLPLGDGSFITGRSFLDAYSDPVKRQHTEDLLRGFVTMETTDPDYELTKAYLTGFLEPYFGPPQVD